MEKLTDQQWRELRSGAKVLAADEHGEKVLLRPDGRVIKLFRRKRLLSSALWRPYARRFAEASRRLNAIGFRAVKVENEFRVPAIRREVVVYPMLEGVELRAKLAKSPEMTDPLLDQLCGLLAQLHAAGVYFRAIHFGNVLVWPGLPMGLIDVSEAQFFRGPLRPALRARNFRPLRKYREDAAAVDEFGRRRFVDAYLNHARMAGPDREIFQRALVRVDPSWIETS